jgi:galactokinase
MCRVEYLTARDLAGPASDRFAQLFNRPSDAVGRAPGRVNLIGEHTDYNGGLCLPVALPHAAVAVVARRDDLRIRVVSGQTGAWEGTLGDLAPAVTTGPAYVTGTLWALRDAGVEIGGLDVYVDSDVPMGSGLSSSEALICATAVALAGDQLSPEALVEVAIRAETEGVGAPTGGLDQTVSVLAEPGHALLLDFGAGRDRVVGQVDWRPESAGLALLVVDTGVRHSHAGGGYGDRRAECESAAAALGVASLRDVTDPAPLTDPVLARRVRHVVTEIERVRRVVVAVETADWAGVGRLFTESHASLRDDFEVSCPELDAVVEAALGSGALGARMTGGGFGGSALVLAPRVELDRVGAAITTAFKQEGWSGLSFLDAPASAGASVSH